MAARITLGDLKEIYEIPSGLEAKDVEDIINRGNRFVNALLLSVGLTTDQLRDVELYVAAYFANAQRPHINQASLGGVSSTQGASYSYVGLWSDPYGQRAIELDTSGTLRDYARKQQSASRGGGEATGGTEFSVFGGSSANPHTDFTDPEYL